ncbi:hypothetical protein GCM10023074_39240 [Microbispora amethystogenes]|uniref:Uncharacterized protein n=1 Tax=Microbispora amethystogenes TaxID=1427754 RepID=A0ABQ4FCY5_9ACTN|nr:hypothetical protein Mam01_27680 [Microbispora amethystogenes]
MGGRLGDVQLDARRGGDAEQIVEQILIVGYGQRAWHRCLPVVREDHDAREAKPRRGANRVLWTAPVLWTKPGLVATRHPLGERLESAPETGRGGSETVEKIGEKGRPPPGGIAGVAVGPALGG